MVAKFPVGLSPEYSVVKINILTSDKIPDLSDVFHRLNRLALNISQSSADSNSSALALSGGCGCDSFSTRGEKGWGRRRVGRGKLHILFLYKTVAS